MNRATLDRPEVTIRLGYLDPLAEAKVIQTKTPGAPKHWRRCSPTSPT